MEIPDLFEHPELLPPDVKQLMEHWQEHTEPTANELNDMKTQFEAIGYTFDFGLALEPFNLRRL